MSYVMVTLLIGFVIWFHELGHFIAAKKAGIGIAVFSLGFGPKLVGRKWRGTEYRLSLIPLGGYVLPEIDDEREFFVIPVNKRIWMALGGPLASFTFSVIGFAIVFPIMYGLSFANVFIKPFMYTLDLLRQMIVSLPGVFTHAGQLSGIVGVVVLGGSVVGPGWTNALQFAAFVSLNFVVLNLLPIPVLDGGKVALYLLEKMHPKLRRLHVPLALAGWIFMIGLMAYVTVCDIGRLLGGPAPL